ncbi:MAG: hypothetical protein V8S75_03270 [[Ruminococcus] torques]
MFLSKSVVASSADETPDIFYQIIWRGGLDINCDSGGFSALAGAKATIAHLPGAKLKQLQVAEPPMELQDQFAVFVVKLTDKSKVAVQKALDEAQLLFDSLMQEYFG